MKILILNDYAAPTGGAEVLTIMLRDGLRRRGHEARLFASRACDIEGKSGADYQCFGTTSLVQPLVMAANLSALRRLRRVLSDFRPDVVHVNMFMWQLSPVILPLLRKIPSLHHVQMYSPICPLGTKMLPSGEPCHVAAGLPCYSNRCFSLRAWFAVMLQMYLWRRWRHTFDRIVANSDAVRTRLVAEGIEVTEVIWNAVPIRPPRPPLKAPPTVAFAGRLVREKGVDVLIRAFAKVKAELPESRLIVAGEGPEKRSLKQMIAQLELSSSVSMLGHLARSEIEALFATAWVQAVPSRWEEPFGLVAPEAMMRGTAVVGSACGALTEIVENKRTGLLTQTGDVTALARSLLLLLRDRDLAETMGRAGREVALARFSEPIYLDKFLDLYQLISIKGKPKNGF